MSDASNWATAFDPVAGCFPAMSRSRDDVEGDPVCEESSSSNSASNDVVVRQCRDEIASQQSPEYSAVGVVDDTSRPCREEGTPHESSAVAVVHSVDDTSESVQLESEADDDGKPTQSRPAIARERRWRSDEADAGRGRRRRDRAGEEVGGAGSRRCRSLERRSSARPCRDAVTSPEDRTVGELGFGGAIRKSDSFDSGIDTKSESTSPRSDVVDARLPDAASPPPSTRRDVTPEVLSLTAAELDYDRAAAALVRRLGNDDDAAELRHALLTSWHRTPTCYMCGVFDSVVRPLSANQDDVDDCGDVSVSDDMSAEELKVGSDTSLHSVYFASFRYNHTDLFAQLFVRFFHCNLYSFISPPHDSRKSK